MAAKILIMIALSIRQFLVLSQISLITRVRLSEAVVIISERTKDSQSFPIKVSKTTKNFFIFFRYVHFYLRLLLDLCINFH